MNFTQWFDDTNKRRVTDYRYRFDQLSKNACQRSFSQSNCNENCNYEYNDRRVSKMTNDC